MGPYREVQKFTGLPSAQGAVGNTGLSGHNHGYDVPINELVFNTPVVARFLKLEINQNHGAVGTGYYRMRFSGDNTPAVPPPRCAGTETLNPGAGWPSKEVFGSASSLNTWYSPRSIDYTDSPHYSPYVTVFPDASTNRWWTGSHCADGTCSDTFITYEAQTRSSSFLGGQGTLLKWRRCMCPSPYVMGGKAFKSTAKHGPYRGEGGRGRYTPNLLTSRLYRRPFGAL